MVDLKLETLDVDNVPKDTFVAVRVGEVQKLSRVTAAKNYKFPQAAVGERKFGRVDVFRRVGSASISIKNSGACETTQEVSVELQDAPVVNFRVQLGAKPEAQEKRMQDAEKLKASGANPKVQQAKHYLLEHNLEERLSEAMQAVLREKPEKPEEFIFDLLRKSASDYKKLGDPPLDDRGAWTQSPGVDTISDRQALSQSAVDNDVLRLQAKQALLDASADGTLVKVLEESTSLPPSPTVGGRPVESLRVEAQKNILQASRDGSLQSTLQEAISLAQTDKPPGINVADEQRSFVMLPTSALYGSSFASTGLTPNFVVR